VQAIVFDLDGTLVDSLPDILNSFRYAFYALGLPVPEKDEVREELGKPLWDMYSHFAPIDTISELVAAYRVHYPRHFLDNSRPFPGVKEVLSQLRDRGFSLAVATTKRTCAALEFTNALGLDVYFDHIQGTDGFPHKPDPDVIFRALGALGALGESGLWMVGDSSTDIEAGKAAELSTYAVTWGAHDAGRLRKAGPDALESSLDRLLDLVV
jgi:phosphoglycolate phosphatase